MKKFIIFAIILFLLIPTITTAGRKHSEEYVLGGILEKLQGDFLEGDLNMGGIILDEFISQETMEYMGEQVRDLLGIVGEEVDINRDITDLEGQYYTREIIYEKGFNQMSIYGYNSNGNIVTAIIASYLSPEMNKGETTLFINLIKDKQNFSINGIIDRVEGLFNDYGKPLEITTCIIGTIEGQLIKEDLTKEVLKALKRYKGKVVEEYVDSSILSYTAYTPLIESSIFSGEKKVNLNLAIRYNEYEDKTYIWIGTPIITTGY